VYYADQHLYVKRWEHLIASRHHIDIVEILTWNDYGESSYIGPIAGAQPNSEAWVNGFDHTAWLDVTAYYAQAFKTGVFPALIKDRIFLWTRPHPKRASVPDAVGKPDNFDLVNCLSYLKLSLLMIVQLNDAVWVLVMLTDSARLTLLTSEKHSKSFKLSSGVHKISIPINPGDGVCVRIVRNGQTVLDFVPQFTFQGNPKSYNYNAFVASSG
jgi:glucan endo-1,3-alpha-glucosidase